MPYVLRTLSLRDVARALQRRELRLALRLTQHVCSNAVNVARFQLRKHARRTS